MILEKGDMWSVFGKTDLFLITTNPIVRKDGAVVMGRGIAKQAKDKFPKLPYHFGTYLRQFILREPPSIGTIGYYDGQRVGYFMVKDHWAAHAVPAIIEHSANTLSGFIAINPGWNARRVDLNFPGIGNGKLKREDVLPLIEKLPDNVHVWEY